MNTISPATEVAIDPQLRQRIDSIRALPTLPETYNQLTQELSQPDFSMAKISTVISKDIAISAKILQVVNSAYFALTTRIENVQQAVNYLGFDTVKGVVLSAGVYSNAKPVTCVGYSPKLLYERGLAVGAKARFIAYSYGMGRRQMDDALTAGLLHEVGKLVLLTGFEKEFECAFARSQEEGIPLHVAIQNTIGADDSIIGGYLLASWGLSKSIVDAVVNHYQPSKVNHREFDVTSIVHLSYASEYDQTHRVQDAQESAFDMALLNTLGMTNQLSTFKSLTAEAVSMGKSGL